MHIALSIGPTSILMGTDVPSVMPQVVSGSNITIIIQTESKLEADHLFAGLGQDGTIEMPLAKMFWGS
jgi:PhnB protein